MRSVVEYCASEDEVVQAILAAVPARRRLLLQETIQAKRLSIIAAVVPKLRALPNYSSRNVAHIIHAWYSLSSSFSLSLLFPFPPPSPPSSYFFSDSETAKNFLFENKFQNVGQVWNKVFISFFKFYCNFVNLFINTNVLQTAH